MGSFGAALNVSERLRPWYQSGVEFFLPSGRAAARDIEQNSLPEPLRDALDSTLESFPAPWDHFWNKACKTAVVAWTYMDLGNDLGGTPCRERGMLFRSLIQGLQWPAGTSAFWPVSEPADNGCTPRPDMFWSGAVRLGVHHVVCCGSDVLQHIAPEYEHAGSSFLLGPFMVHHVPSPAEMQAMDSASLNNVIRSLSQLDFS